MRCERKELAVSFSTFDAQPVQRIDEALSAASAAGPLASATFRAACARSSCLPGATMAARPAPYIVIHLRSIQSFTGHSHEPCCRSRAYHCQADK